MVAITAMPLKNRFAELLEKKSRSENRYIPLAEVAIATGVARKTLYKWERNELTRFEVDVVEALCKYFGVGVSDLLDYTPAEDKKQKPSR
jgi:putative transcriptional regulator